MLRFREFGVHGFRIHGLRFYSKLDPAKAQRDQASRGPVGGVDKQLFKVSVYAPGSASADETAVSV